MMAITCLLILNPVSKAVVDKQYQEQKSLTSAQTHKIQLSPKGDVPVGVDITLRSLKSAKDI